MLQVLLVATTVQMCTPMYTYTSGVAGAENTHAHGIYAGLPLGKVGLVLETLKHTVNHWIDSAWVSYQRSFVFSRQYSQHKFRCANIAVSRRRVSPASYDSRLMELCFCLNHMAFSIRKPQPLTMTHLVQSDGRGAGRIGIARPRLGQVLVAWCLPDNLLSIYCRWEAGGMRRLTCQHVSIFDFIYFMMHPIHHSTQREIHPRFV